MPRRLLCVTILLIVLSLAACSQNTAAPPTATRVGQPTDTPVPPTGTPGDGEVEMGFTSEGFPYKGNANSPVTLWEFSEFQ